MALSIQQVYKLARNAGLSHDAAVIATAIAIGESGLNPKAVGDTTLTDATWGPSIGLWQIRSVKAESGTGKSRDASRLKNPEFNATSMYSISGGGRTWGAWTIYTNGDYEDHLPRVRKAVANVGGNYGSASGLGVTQTGSEFPDKTGGWDSGSSRPDWGDGKQHDPGLLGDAAELLGDGVDKAGDAAGAAVTAALGLMIKELGPVVLLGIAVLGGFSLITVGAWVSIRDD